MQGESSWAGLVYLGDPINPIQGTHTTTYVGMFFENDVSGNAYIKISFC